MHRNEKNVLAQEESRHVPHLYRWYVDWRSCHDGTECAIAHGIVTGHQRLQDTTHIHTSKIVDISMDKEMEEVIIQTLNTEYHCRLSDCDFSKISTCDFIPELLEYAKMYKKEKEYVQEDNTILLVLSDHEQYYFETMRLKKDGVICIRHILAGTVKLIKARKVF